MNLTERRMEVFHRLQQDGVVELASLAKEFGVSTMTVRRDLQLLQQQGYVTMSYGSAYLNRSASDMAPSFSTKTGVETAKKQAIGRAAAELVQDGDTIIIDAGTTTLQLINYLDNKHLTIITNSLPVCTSAGRKPTISLIFAPGEYSNSSACVVGDMTVEFLLKVHADKAFMGANGFNARGGANEPILADAGTKRAMMQAADVSYLLVDSSKYGNDHLIRQTPLDQYEAIITDIDFPFEYRSELEDASTRVIYA